MNWKNKYILCIIYAFQLHQKYECDDYKLLIEQEKLIKFLPSENRPKSKMQLLI